MIRRGLRILSFALAATGILIIITASGAEKPGKAATDKTGAGSRKSNIIDYVGSYDSAQYPRSELEALFTTADIVVDGIADAAYKNAPASAGTTTSCPVPQESRNDCSHGVLSSFLSAFSSGIFCCRL
jgi:hypothetical protein